MSNLSLPGAQSWNTGSPRLPSSPGLLDTQVNQPPGAAEMWGPALQGWGARSYRFRPELSQTCQMDLGKSYPAEMVGQLRGLQTGFQQLASGRGSRV